MEFSEILSGFSSDKEPLAKAHYWTVNKFTT